tara:strand:- start:249 stop:428 length:180 start_codon:yes stop_codon:yes gene_type:complete
MVIVQTYYNKVIDHMGRDLDTGGSGFDVYTWNVYKDAKTGQVLAEVLLPTTSPNYLIMK